MLRYLRPLAIRSIRVLPLKFAPIMRKRLRCPLAMTGTPRALQNLTRRKLRHDRDLCLEAQFPIVSIEVI